MLNSASSRPATALAALPLSGVRAPGSPPPSRVMALWRRWSATVGLALLLAAPFDASAIPTTQFLPLATGFQWTYLVNGVETRVQTITGNQSVNGALTWVESETPSQDRLFLTNDNQGIRQHSSFDAATGVTVTVTPPIILVPADVNPAAPPLISQSGTAVFSVSGFNFPFGYSSSSQFLGIEELTVSGRLFRAAHLRVSITVSGSVGADFLTETDVDDIWAVEGVGIVKQILAVTSNTAPPSTDSYELTSTNQIRLDPDPFVFAPQSGVRPNSLATSNAIRVINTTGASPIRINGGEYSIDGGAFTATPGFIANGHSVVVRLVSFPDFNVETPATLTIGGVNGTFNVTTQAPVKRAFAASFGSDANHCGLATPCRSLAAAVSVTAAGGEVVMLDSAGYGPVTVTRPVSIIAPQGIHAGVAVTAGDGITVNAGAFDRVVLRGLTVNGQGGSSGIVVQSGHVHIENCVVANMGTDGIQVQGGTVYISDSVLRSNTRWGIGMAGFSDVRVSDSHSVQNGNSGIHTEAAGALILDRVRLDNNGVGVSVSPSSAAVSVVMRDSTIAGNNGIGISVIPSGAGGSANVLVERSSAMAQGSSGISLNPVLGASGSVTIVESVVADNNGAGIGAVGSNATVYVRGSTVVRNASGFSQGAGAVLNTCGDNLLALNAIPSIGAITPVPCNQ